jgi:IS5 family transposase
VRQNKNGNRYNFGIKVYIGVDAESGSVQVLLATPASLHDITPAEHLLHQDIDVLADSGYSGIEKRKEAKNLRLN